MFYSHNYYSIKKKYKKNICRVRKNLNYVKPFESFYNFVDGKVTFCSLICQKNKMNIKDIYRILSPKFQNLHLNYKVNFKQRYGYGLPAHQKLYDIINAQRDNYKLMLDKALSYKEYLWQIKDNKDETDDTKPRWNNNFLPGLDIIMIYTMIAQYKPKNYIEIGSGNSTKVVYKVRTEHNIDIKITSIDPCPRAEIDNLTDKAIRMPVENIDLTIFDSLEENDIMFLDGSHSIYPNSDAMVFFMDILPRLKKGVIVHIHDIYLPYDYPQFMIDRFYNEQYGLAMYLLANPDKFTPIMPNYFVYEDKELSKQISPIWEHSNLQKVERHGGSFWFKINMD